MKKHKLSKWRKIKIWFSNNFKGAQYCLNCGTDLKNEPVDGFGELDHHGAGERKWRPKCRKPFFV